MPKIGGVGVGVQLVLQCSVYPGKFGELREIPITDVVHSFETLNIVSLVWSLQLFVCYPTY